MAKYIIDIPDKYEKCYAQSPSETLYIPMQVGTCDYNIWVGTGLSVIPYTEPDEDEIRQMAHEEAWDFATSCIDMDGKDFYECFKSDSVYYLTECTYSEVKTKYDEWKKKKKEICVGDEVVYHGNRYVVGYCGEDEVYHIVDQNWIRTVVQGDYQIFKTGRHFPEIKELLEKMKSDRA